jgi:putative hemolysin
MSLISTPLVKFLSFSTEIMLKILGIKPQLNKSVYDDDIMFLMEEGLRTGDFEKNEKEIIEKTLKLSDKSVKTIMTHRTNIIFIDVNKSNEEIINIIKENPHARYPVCEGNADKIIGTIETIKFFEILTENNKFKFKTIINEPLIINQDKTVYELLDTFRRESINIAVVVNNLGETAGLITDGDILESLVGDIEKKEPMFVKREDGSFLIDCMMEIDNFKEIFNITKLPINEANINTVGGFISTYFGIIPSTGASFIWGGYRFEIVDMDRRRIDKILVSSII